LTPAQAAAPLASAVEPWHGCAPAPYRLWCAPAHLAWPQRRPRRI